MVSDSLHPLVIGHRGAPGYRPEHSESSYRLACELGADAVEPDIVVTRDGVLVVRHENEISGTTDVASRKEFADRRATKTIDGKRLTGWFTEDFTWAELSKLRCVERLKRIRPENREFDRTEPILRLVDVLRIIDQESASSGREIAVIVEVKHADYFASIGVDIGALLLSELSTAGWADRPERLVIECFELGVLEQLRDAGVRASLVFLAERIGAPADEVARARAGGPRANPYGWYRTNAGLDSLVGRVDGVSVDKSSLIRTTPFGLAAGPTDLAQRAHERGLLVYTWTLRPENRYLNMRFHSSMRHAEWGDWQAEFALIISSGVDGIFVDHPDLGVAARGASGS
ncbi:glycerophosphodiester phosphodiesterase family protein [Leucobacter denitrificans]|uniref:glycerophosphodiester phosphodiesterase n=1 Tax=Leucobacter denitrificans TaxID=683042 RepID=A0A7G9S6K9_9MICO|nr:glycerophosphodiester phosphodiesterase family protein [Leucobacter denitrificans]QNN63484.1 glycerophosphodiester phosphodiesterase [Leucobacter denitrificans]